MSGKTLVWIDWDCLEKYAPSSVPQTGQPRAQRKTPDRDWWSVYIPALNPPGVEKFFMLPSRAVSSKKKNSRNSWDVRNFLQHEEVAKKSGVRRQGNVLVSLKDISGLTRRGRRVIEDNGWIDQSVSPISPARLQGIVRQKCENRQRELNDLIRFWWSKVIVSSHITAVAITE